MGVGLHDLERRTGGGVKVAFCFPGQGSQDVGMGRAMAEQFPEAQAVFDEASGAAGFDVARLCFEGPIEELTQTELQQPALVTTSLACLRAVETLGVQPDFVVGHSVGEYSALAAAEALSDSEAIALVSERGRATAEAAREHPGAMAAVLGLEDAVVEELCAGIDNVWPANYNCPGQIVVSGENAAVDRLIEEAAVAGARKTVKLRVGGAFHSPLVGRAADRLRPALESVRFQEPARPFMSTVTAQIESAERLVDLLVQQLTGPVKFTQSVRGLVQQGVGMFVEVGPGQVLSGLIRRCDRSLRTISVGDPESLRKLQETLSAA
jgi:[acyl-carrier-protein] S-malonyltransferase